MPRAHPVPRQRRHRDRLVRSHQLARTRRSRERESLGCQRCGTRTPLGWKKGARGLFRLIPRRRKFVSSTDCLTAAVHGRLQLADLRRPARRIARSKPAGQILIFNVSKVASPSPTGAPALGQERSIADSPQSGHMRETASTGTSARRAASCAASARWAAATKEMGLLPEHGGPRRS